MSAESNIEQTDSVALRLKKLLQLLPSNGSASLLSPQLAELGRLLSTAVDAHVAALTRESSSGGSSNNAKNGSELISADASAKYIAFLSAAQQFGRCVLH